MKRDLSVFIPQTFSFFSFLDGLLYGIKLRSQMSAAFGGVGELISAAGLIRVNTVLSSIAMVLSSALK